MDILRWNARFQLRIFQLFRNHRRAIVLQVSKCLQPSNGVARKPPKPNQIHAGDSFGSERSGD